MAQKRVTGTVVDEQNQPMVGATVRVSGTKQFTQTDAKGHFVLPSVPASAKTLTISYIGYETTEASVGENVSVKMKENSLEEAVIVGYGTAKKLGTVVGSVTTVKSENIENKPVTTPLDALQGKVAGVSILSSSGDVGDLSTVNTTIRGVGSLTASNEPLFVVDGSPVGATVFYMLNQNDIENMTVLRDASATSIYGSRAANGVVYVTTKKGHRNEKATIKIGQQIGFSQVAHRVGNPMSGAELAAYHFHNGVIDADQYASIIASGVNTDWQKYFFDKSAPYYQTDFSVSGGSENTRYYTSASWNKRDGLTPNSKNERFTVRTNIDSKANNWFRYGLNLGLAYDRNEHDDRNNDGGLYLNSGVLGSVIMPTYVNPYDQYGNPLDFLPFAYGGTAMNQWLSHQYLTRHSNYARLTGSAFIELTPVKGLTLRSQLGLDGYDYRWTRVYDPTSPDNDAGQGNRGEEFDRYYQWAITNTAEYKWNINENHALTFLLGHEGILTDQNGFYVTTRGMTDPRLMELDHGTTIDMTMVTQTLHSKSEYLSFFGRLDYELLNKYFFNFTVRNDRCSRFGADNRSATFLSGGAMWILKAEKFLKNVTWLDDLKLKVNVGTTGNSGVGNYASLGTTSTTRYGGNNGLVLATPGNKELGWEKQIQTNVGISGRIFNRANIELNWYRRTTQDMLMAVPLPYYSGFGTETRNVASMRNQGIEFTFDVDVVKNWNGLNVNVYGNIAKNNLKVISLFNGLTEYSIPNTGRNLVVGEDPFEMWVPIRAGIDPADGQIMWYIPDENGEPTDQITKEWDSEALRCRTHHTMQTPVFGGFGLTASWRGLTLRADFSYVLGKYMTDNVGFFTHNSAQAASGYNQDRSMWRQWEKPGDITDVPAFGTSNRFDSTTFHNASFCRLKNLSLSYDLPGSWMEATGFIQNIRLMATARNLLTITKYPGADPETYTNVAKAQFPNTREFTFGVEFTF